MEQLGNYLNWLYQRRKLGLLVIGLISLGLALLDRVTPPEVPVDALHAIPIWLALNLFGWRGGLLVTCSSTSLFYLANYQFSAIYADATPARLLPSVGMTFLLLLSFCYGAYHYLLGQRRLLQTRQTLEKRLAELAELHRQAELLHQQATRLAVADERNRLAREIHDVLAQGFMAILLQVETAQRQPFLPVPTRASLGQIEEVARLNLQEARRSVANLRPQPLDGLSLPQAIQQKLVATVGTDQPAIKFRTSGDYRPLDSEIEAVLFRVAQEALNNALHHSQASQLELALDYDDEEVCLTVSDNGRGFDPLSRAGQPEGRASFGLQIMQERAQLIGGWLSLQSAPAAGCRVRLLVPYTRSRLNSVVAEPAVETQPVG